MQGGGVVATLPPLRQAGLKEAGGGLARRARQMRARGGWLGGPEGVG